MKATIIILIALLSNFNSIAQRLQIVTSSNNIINATIINSATISSLLVIHNGLKNDSKYVKWTSKTFDLNNGSIIIEFFDKQGILIKDSFDFNQIKDIRFVKNRIWNLKKNISYKIDLDFEKGQQIIEIEKPKTLTQFQKYRDDSFKVYQLTNGQLLLLNNFTSNKSATLYPDLKTLASENNSIEEVLYGNEDDEHLMKRLAAGDPLSDFEPNEHLIYPKYLNDVIKYHKLKLVEQKIFIGEYFSNLYQSEINGKYFLFENPNQKNWIGDTLPIVNLFIYDKIEDVRNAQKQYQKFKDSPVKNEHFYQKHSDDYQDKFPEHTNELIDELSKILNIERRLLTFDEKGIEIVDEAINWNRENYNLFDQYFPAVLAFYGECYIKKYKGAQWEMKYETKDKVWIPQLKLNNKDYAWDWIDIYKDLMEMHNGLKFNWDFYLLLSKDLKH